MPDELLINYVLLSKLGNTMKKSEKSLKRKLDENIFLKLGAKN